MGRHRPDAAATMPSMRFVISRIYVIRIEDELIVKRPVRSKEAGWMLVSDNPDKDRFPTQPCPEAAIGEVKWYGQSFE